MRCLFEIGNLRLLLLIAISASLPVPSGLAQQVPLQHENAAAMQGSIAGIVRDGGSHPVTDATVRLEQAGRITETKTNPDGGFAFSGLQPGTYRLSSEKSGLISRPVDTLVVSPGAQKHID